MTHCEDDDLDIYSDLNILSYKDELKELQGKNVLLQKQVEELQSSLTQAIQDKEQFKKRCDVLSFNLSSLLKTARSEIKRKDSSIAELRERCDDLVFRRNHRTHHDAQSSRNLKNYEERRSTGNFNDKSVETKLSIDARCTDPPKSGVENLSQEISIADNDPERQKPSGISNENGSQSEKFVPIDDRLRGPHETSSSPVRRGSHSASRRKSLDLAENDRHYGKVGSCLKNSEHPTRVISLETSNSPGSYCGNRRRSIDLCEGKSRREKQGKVRRDEKNKDYPISVSHETSNSPDRRVSNCSGQRKSLDLIEDKSRREKQGKSTSELRSKDRSKIAEENLVSSEKSIPNDPSHGVSSQRTSSLERRVSHRDERCLDISERRIRNKCRENAAAGNSSDPRGDDFSDNSKVSQVNSNKFTRAKLSVSQSRTSSLHRKVSRDNEKFSDLHGRRKVDNQEDSNIPEKNRTGHTGPDRPSLDGDRLIPQHTISPLEKKLPANKNEASLDFPEVRSKTKKQRNVGTDDLKKKECAKESEVNGLKDKISVPDNDKQGAFCKNVKISLEKGRCSAERNYVSNNGDDSNRKKIAEKEGCVLSPDRVKECSVEQNKSGPDGVQCTTEENHLDLKENKQLNLESSRKVEQVLQSNSDVKVFGTMELAGNENKNTTSSQDKNISFSEKTQEFSTETSASHDENIPLHIAAASTACWNSLTVEVGQDEFTETVSSNLLTTVSENCEVSSSSQIGVTLFSKRMLQKIHALRPTFSVPSSTLQAPKRANCEKRLNLNEKCQEETVIKESSILIENNLDISVSELSHKCESIGGSGKEVILPTQSVDDEKESLGVENVTKEIDPVAVLEDCLLNSNAIGVKESENRKKSSSEVEERSDENVNTTPGINSLNVKITTIDDSFVKVNETQEADCSKQCGGTPNPTQLSLHAIESSENSPVIEGSTNSANISANNHVNNCSVSELADVSNVTASEIISPSMLVNVTVREKPRPSVVESGSFSTSIVQKELLTKEQQEGNKMTPIRPNLLGPRFPRTVYKKIKKVTINPINPAYTKNSGQLPNSSGTQDNLSVHCKNDLPHTSGSLDDSCKPENVPVKVDDNDKGSINVGNTSTPNETVDGSILEKNVEKTTSKLIESLFGSPLKWIEDNSDSKRSLSPLCFDSSTNSLKNEPSPLSRPVNLAEPEESGKCVVNLSSSSSEDIESPASSKSLVDARESFISSNSGSSRSAYHSKVTTTTLMKYDDSNLGQFDDTIQFISALSTVKPRVSPLGTPEKSSDNIVSEKSFENSSPPEGEKIETVEEKSEKSNFDMEHSVTNCISEKPFSSLSRNHDSSFEVSGAIEKPVNVLKPRKAPRKLKSPSTPCPKNVRISCLDNKAIATVCHLVSALKDNSHLKTSPVNKKKEAKLISPTKQYQNIEIEVKETSNVDSQSTSLDKVSEVNAAQTLISKQPLLSLNVDSEKNEKDSALNETQVKQHLELRASCTSITSPVPSKEIKSLSYSKLKGKINSRKESMKIKFIECLPESSPHFPKISNLTKTNVIMRKPKVAKPTKNNTENSDILLDPCLKKGSAPRQKDNKTGVDDSSADNKNIVKNTLLCAKNLETDNHSTSNVKVPCSDRSVEQIEEGKRKTSSTRSGEVTRRSKDNKIYTISEDKNQSKRRDGIDRTSIKCRASGDDSELHLKTQSIDSPKKSSSSSKKSNTSSTGHSSERSRCKDFLKPPFSPDHRSTRDSFSRRFAHNNQFQRQKPYHRDKKNHPEPYQSAFGSRSRYYYDLKYNRGRSSVSRSLSPRSLRRRLQTLDRKPDYSRKRKGASSPNGKSKKVCKADLRSGNAGSYKELKRIQDEASTPKSPPRQCSQDIREAGECLNGLVWRLILAENVPERPQYHPSPHPDGMLQISEPAELVLTTTPMFVPPTVEVRQARPTPSPVPSSVSSSSLATPSPSQSSRKLIVRKRRSLNFSGSQTIIESITPVKRTLDSLAMTASCKNQEQNVSSGKEQAQMSQSNELSSPQNEVPQDEKKTISYRLPKYAGKSGARTVKTCNPNKLRYSSVYSESSGSDDVTTYHMDSSASSKSSHEEWKP